MRWEESAKKEGENTGRYKEAYVFIYRLEDFPQSRRKRNHGTIKDHVGLFENADFLGLTQDLLNKNLWR